MLDKNWSTAYTSFQTHKLSDSYSIVSCNLTVRTPSKDGNPIIERSGVGAVAIHSALNQGNDNDQAVCTAFQNAYKKALKHAKAYYTVTEEDEEAEAINEIDLSSLSFSDKTKEKISGFVSRLGLAKTDLNDFVAEMHPKSNGDPRYLLTTGSEDDVVNKFLESVEKRLNQA